MVDKQLVLYSSRQGAISYSGRSFNALSDLIEFIDSLPEGDQYIAQSDILIAMVDAQDRVCDNIEEFFEYTKRSSAYQLHCTKSEFDDVWSEATRIVEEHQQRRNRYKEAQANILSQNGWDTPQALSFLTRLKHSASFLAALRKLAATITFEDAVPQLNYAIVRRFTRPRQGVSKFYGPTAKDVDDVRENRIRELEIRPEHLLEHTLRYGPEGLLEHDDGCPVERIGDVHMDGGSSIVAQSSDGETHDASKSDLSLSDEPLTPSTSDSDAVDISLIEDAERELRDESASEEPASKKRRLDGDTQGAKCSCSNDVSDTWKKAVMQKRELGLDMDIKLLARMQKFERVCYAHMKALGGHLGLMVKSLGCTQLLQRLQDVHNNRFRLGELKTHNNTFSWFRVANRPARPSDMLGPYKFVHELNGHFDFDQSVILQRLHVDVDAWTADGSVNVMLFDWWFSGPVGKIIELEYGMYRHHLRDINGKSNYGWLRNCFYSIGQQLMRQDPAYYALYAALRPDQQWRLVTYPYYAKYAVEGDQTYFRHIDLNIPDLLANARGASMIQGSVSIDNETSENCTVIMAGMHRKLQQWWDLCVARGQETDGFVHRITERMFTSEDAQKLGVAWKRVPCKQGEVRITLPHIPHGSDGPSKSTRRTMLPWFVGVQDDHEALEVIEGGTWSELSVAHRDLVSPKATPSGLANRYGAIPYRFPAAVEVSGLGALSDALVCRRRWDSPAVIQERDVVLNGSEEDFGQYICAWRERAVQAAVAAFKLVQQEEMRAFGSRSFFYHLEREQREGIPFPIIAEDLEELGPETWADDRTVKIRFAEDGAEDDE